MRKFHRAPEPEVLQQNWERWAQQWVKLQQSNTSAKFSWYRVDGQTAREHVLPILAEQTSLHCSFCDAFPVAGVSNETIEHFKPKSKFPELAYTWSNLYYCCDACQSSKGETWDELLLNPDADDYSCSRFFEFDFTTGEIKPNRRSAEDDQRRAMKTIELYGLDSPQRRRNRRMELRRRAQTEGTNNEEHLWAYRDFLGLNTSEPC